MSSIYDYARFVSILILVSGLIGICVDTYLCIYLSVHLIQWIHVAQRHMARAQTCTGMVVHTGMLVHTELHRVLPMARPTALP
jgi:hypothetical protein